MSLLRAGRAIALAVTAAGAAAIGVIAASAPGEEVQESTSREAEQVSVRLGSLQVGVDPETGELRPLTPSEAALLAREMRRRFPPRDIGEPTLRPDGALSAVVVPNVLSFSVARVREGGGLSVECADGTEDAIEHLTHVANEKKPRSRGDR